MFAEPTLTLKNVAWKFHGCRKPHGTKCVLVQKWDAKLKLGQMIMKVMKNDLCLHITSYFNRFHFH